MEQAEGLLYLLFVIFWRGNEYQSTNRYSDSLGPNKTPDGELWHVRAERVPTKARRGLPFYVLEITDGFDRT